MSCQTWRRPCRGELAPSLSSRSMRLRAGGEQGDRAVEDPEEGVMRSKGEAGKGKMGVPCQEKSVCKGPEA